MHDGAGARPRVVEGEVQGHFLGRRVAADAGGPSRRASRAGPDRASPRQALVGVISQPRPRAAALILPEEPAVRPRSNSDRAKRRSPRAAASRSSPALQHARAPWRRNPAPPKLPDLSASARSASRRRAAPARRDRSPGRCRRRARPSAVDHGARGLAAGDDEAARRRRRPGPGRGRRRSCSTRAADFAGRGAHGPRRPPRAVPRNRRAAPAARCAAHASQRRRRR